MAFVADVMVQIYVVSQSDDQIFCIRLLTYKKLLAVLSVLCSRCSEWFFVVVDNVSQGSLSEEVEADAAKQNLSQEVFADGVNSDEEIDQNEDIWLRADATPPAVSKSSSYKWQV